MRFEPTADEIAEKERRIQTFLKARNWAGLLIGGKRNFGWATGGRDNHVVKGSDGGVASALFTADGSKYLLCTNIEEGRIREEERLEAQGFRFVTGPWYAFDAAAEVAKLTGGAAFGSDIPMAGATFVGDREFAPMRYSLTPGEIARYRWLGRVTGQAMATTAQAVDPGMSEFEVGALLDHFLADEGVTPYLTLVAADERIARYRHPTPTDNTVERIVMYVTCAEAYGLIACATRLVSFGPIGDDLKTRHDACSFVETAFNLSTVPGAKVADIFAAGLEAYATQGFADEWKLHHQGGATGYAGRDYAAVPEIAETVHPNQAFAWNPSITGTKLEDTILATTNGPVELTTSPDWPTVRVATSHGAMDRPLIWER